MIIIRILTLSLAFLTAYLAFAVDEMPLVTDPYAVFSAPKVSIPTYLSPSMYPMFNTRITRIAGDTGQNISFSDGGSSTWGLQVRHAYSKIQPWNADGTLIALYNDGVRMYLDGITYQPKFEERTNYYRGEDRWHPSLMYPNTLINAGGNNLEWFDIVNSVQTRYWSLPISVQGIGNGEGNVSNDGRYVALADKASMFIVDMDPQPPYASYSSDNKRIGPVRNVLDCGMVDCSIDWVSVSPSGKYAVIQYAAHPPRVFDINPDTLALTPHAVPTNSTTCTPGDHAQGFLVNIGHADMTMNPFDNNEDVIIGQKEDGCPAGVSSVMIVRLKDNAVASLTMENTATMSHISARNLQRPGWVYVTYLDSANYQWDVPGLRYSNEIVALKIDGSGSVERLTNTHSYNLGIYEAQEHAVPSPDGKRVLWASNAALNGNGSLTDIKTYVVDTRP